MNISFCIICVLEPVISRISSKTSRTAGLLDVFCSLRSSTAPEDTWKWSGAWSHLNKVDKKQTFVSAGAVWRTGCEQDTGQAEPITAALATCPAPTARIKKIPGLRGREKIKKWPYIGRDDCNFLTGFQSKPRNIQQFIVTKQRKPSVGDLFIFSLFFCMWDIKERLEVETEPCRLLETWMCHVSFF